METVWDSWTKAGGKNKVGASKLLSSLQADTAFWEKLSDEWLPTSHNKLVTKAAGIRLTNLHSRGASADLGNSMNRVMETFENEYSAWPARQKEMFSPPYT